jgi:AcrR family transcriptional regulator
VSAVGTWPVRRQSRERNRKALLAAAAALFAERGYGGTSLDAVAQRAGVTTGAIYSIFGSKVGLFTELLHPAWDLPPLAKLDNGRRDLGGLLEAYGRAWARTLQSAGAGPAMELALELQLATLRDPAALARERDAFGVGRAELARDLAAAASARGVSLPVRAADLATSLIAAMQGLALVAAVEGAVDERLFGAVARRLLSRAG